MDYTWALRSRVALLRAPLWLRQALEMVSPSPEWRLHLRDITSATDTRTSIAAIIPGSTGAGHTEAIGLTYWPECRLDASRAAFWRRQRAGLTHEGFPSAAALNSHLVKLGLPAVRRRGEQMELW